MPKTATYPSNVVQKKSDLIREQPRQYIGSLDEKIKIYIQQLKEFEVKCNLPGADREILLDEITLLNDSILQACAQFEQQENDPNIIKAAQVEFRERTNPLLSKSYCINRCRTWPLGHQGDYKTLELAYKNAPMSDGIGYYLDRYLLATTLGIGVRERLEMLRGLLKTELMSRRTPTVLDVACGSCREVFELAQDIKSSGARFTCVDLDPEALNFSRDRLENAGLLDHVALVTFNALRLFDYETAVAEFGMQDIVYSIGFFDYLPDDFLVKLLRTLYLLLNPGGKLIAAFKDSGRYRSQIYHWLVDWDGFQQRTQADFDRLLRQAEIPFETTSMSRVESGAIIFYSAARK